MVPGVNYPDNSFQQIKSIRNGLNPPNSVGSKWPTTQHCWPGPTAKLAWPTHVGGVRCERSHRAPIRCGVMAASGAALTHPLFGLHREQAEGKRVALAKERVTGAHW
jgi:hypothetical protein